MRGAGGPRGHQAGIEPAFSGGVRSVLVDDRFHRLIQHLPSDVWLGDYT